MTIRLTEEQLDEAVGGLIDDDAVWAIRPMMLAAAAAFSGIGRPRRMAKRIAPWLKPRAGIADYWAFDGDLAMFWTTANQRRSFGQRASGADLEVRSARAFDQVAGGRRRALNLAGRIAARTPLQADGLYVPLAHLLHVAQAKLQFYSELVARLKPHVVLVATQHSLQPRCLAIASARAGIPTVYVPHAPFADNRYYADVPFDIAALRGPREEAAYRLLGAAPAGLVSVGNLGLDEQFGRAVAAAQLPVVAPGAWEERVVRCFLSVAAGALDEPFVVCPHPRSDLDLLRRVLPPRATISRERTSSVLLRGPRTVIQAGSGVALEALLLGLPVIQVELPGKAPNYPVIAEPHVAFVATSRELSGVMRRASKEPGEASSERQAWAREWCVALGDEAEARLTHLLDALPVVDGRVLDGWRRP